MKIPDHLLPVFALVLSAAHMYPKVLAVGGFDDGLVEVGVLDDPVEPAVEDVFVGMGLAIAPFGVRCLGDLDVGCFTKGVLRGIDSSDFDVEGVAAVAGTDDDRLACEGSEWLENFLAKLLERRNELWWTGVVDVVGNCGG